MGNPIIGYSSAIDNKFVDYTPTASTEASGFLDDNLKIYGHRKKHWRSTVITETTITCAFGASKNIVGIVLVDANFSNVYIGGTGGSGETQFTVLKDVKNQRYSLFASKSITDSNSRIRIPSQTPVDGASYFRIGSLIFLDTILTLSLMPAYGCKSSADEKIKTNQFESGAEEDILLGDLLLEKTLKWNVYNLNYESELWTLNSLKKNSYIVYYENNNNTSQVYVCRRRSVIEVVPSGPKFGSVNEIVLNEVG